MRLIDADALMEEEYTWLREGDVLYRIPPSHIDLAPPIDAVPVVRCRECVSDSEDASTGKLWCTKPMGCIGCLEVKPDDFCSRGKSR